MRIVQTFSSASVKAGTQAAAVTVPGLGGIGEIVAAIITLCDTVPQHRNAARQLAGRCEDLFKALEQYEQMSFPGRAVQSQAAVFKCLKDIKDTMQRWSEKSWIYTLVHQGKFEVDIDCCDVQLSDCFAAFMAVSQMELLVRQEERDKRKGNHQDSPTVHTRSISGSSQLSNQFQFISAIFFF